jgi:hypothetical protein
MTTRIEGLLPSEATKSHLAQAMPQVTEVPSLDPEDALLESFPESVRSDPVPGSTGQKARVAPSEDEDEEGRSDKQRLVEGGMAEADIERSLQAARAAARMDR